MTLIATLLEPRLADLRAAIVALDGTAEGFEIRFDAMEETVRPADVRALTPKTLIGTVRRTADGGHYAADEHPRLELLHACLEAGFEFVDVEGATSLGAPEARLIRSRHDFQRTHTDGTIVRWGQDAARNGAVFKLASKVSGFTDTVHLLAAARQLGREGLRHALMGIGEFPRALMHLLGAQFVYGGGRSAAPGQPTLESIRATLRHWGDPAPQATAYLVVGDPIQQSLSPRIHNAAFRTAGLPNAYGALRVANEFELQLLLESAERIGLAGLSVTTPLKDAAFDQAATLTPEATAAHAVNCLKIRDGTVEGHNTDGLGGARIVQRLLPPGGRVLVLGTGGAARALAAQLRDHDVTIAGRAADSLRKVAALFNRPAVPLGFAAEKVREYDLLVNATRAEDPIPIADYRGALFDLHYGPNGTAWEERAAEGGLTFAGGRELLLEQGALAFQYWTGKHAPVPAMRAALEASA